MSRLAAALAAGAVPVLVYQKRRAPQVHAALFGDNLESDDHRRYGLCGCSCYLLRSTRHLGNRPKVNEKTSNSASALTSLGEALWSSVVYRMIVECAEAGVAAEKHTTLPWVSSDGISQVYVQPSWQLLASGRAESVG